MKKRFILYCLLGLLVLPAHAQHGEYGAWNEIGHNSWQGITNFIGIIACIIIGCFFVWFFLSDFKRTLKDKDSGCTLLISILCLIGGIIILLIKCSD